MDLAKNYDELGLRCINALINLKKENPDLWTGRATRLMEGVRRIPYIQEAGPLDLMLILDVSRLSEHRSVSTELEDYFNTLPGFNTEGKSSLLAQDQHLKVLAMLMPFMVSIV